MPSIFVAPPLFFAIAFVFSMLGLGGAQLYVPILFWLGMDLKTQAIPLGVLLNALNSGSAAMVYVRRKMVDWPVAVPLGAAMIVAAPLGALINAQMAVKPLIALVALFTAISAGLMLSRWEPRPASFGTRGRVAVGVAAGSGIGLLSGLIGRGGGSFVMPLLYLIGVDPRTAAATSAVVITGGALSSLISHLATAAQPDWPVWLACGAAVILGGQVGSRFMSARLSSPTLKTILGIVLMGVAAALVVKDIILAV